MRTPIWVTDHETYIPPLFYANTKYRFYHFTPKDIKNYQERKAKAIVTYAYSHAPFFHSHYADYNLDRVWQLPTVDKNLMMDNLSDYNTLGLTRQEILNFCLEVEQSRNFNLRYKGLNVGLSSGTSGNKGVEIVTRREERYLKAALLARYPFIKGEKLNIAFILRVFAPAFNFNFFGHKLTYINQLDTFEHICYQLDLLKPNIVTGPPSILNLIAEATKQNMLDIHPTQIVSYAEILYPDIKKNLQEVFQCPVLEIYKCTEGPIAISCKQGSLHINEDLVAVQLFDQNGQPTKPGQPSSKMYITDLHKTSQPIIHYLLNDVITIDEKSCECGSSFRVIKSILGRADDLWWAYRLADGRLQSIYPDYISRAIITSSDTIKNFQAVQVKPDHVNLILDLESNANKDIVMNKVRKQLTKVFQAYKCPTPNITIELGRPHPNPNSNKLIRVIRTYDPT